MLEEERRHPVLKFLGIVLATFIGAYLAFYFVADTTFNRMTSPEYQMKRMEKMMKRQEKRMHRFEDKIMENPFEPIAAPMLVNLAKESDEYKIIVDLKPLGGDEKNVNVKLDNNIVTVSGEMEKNVRGGERIMNFSQSFYLDEALQADKITKEKKGSKYIITIPFEE